LIQTGRVLEATRAEFRQVSRLARTSRWDCCGKARLRVETEPTEALDVVLLQEYLMVKPAAIEIVRRAYALWQQAGEPEGRDQEFYLQAEKELQENDKDGVGPEPTSL
jgi:hypothetical protein